MFRFRVKIKWQDCVIRFGDKIACAIKLHPRLGEKLLENSEGKKSAVEKAKARSVVEGGGGGLLCDPGSEL